MPVEPTQLARQLAAALEERGIEYAIGGALALGFWGEPRGTLDVDVTLFVSPAQPANCAELLLELGCDFDPVTVLDSLTEHGYCKVKNQETVIDVFWPIVDFYDAARSRRQLVRLGDRRIWIWDAESLVVFKMMFFRRKDLADVEQILRQRGALLDRDWIKAQLIKLYGLRDPRISAWNDLISEQ
ncbi:MAG: hypothetical protein KDA89_19995 [Planctomycetaceae bacterium]|nr:hypothetical protein [Planctomycetaceae bacterium]